MRSQRELPPEWAERMLKLGFSYNNKPSARRLAESAGVTVNAALRVIHRGQWGEATVVALGEAMRDPGFVAEWVGTAPGETWEPPVEARRLTVKQRNLVDDLIRELATTGGESGGPVDTEKMGGGAVAPLSTREQFGTAARHANVPDKED